jgi:hypothetical protein
LENINFKSSSWEKGTVTNPVIILVLFSRIISINETEKGFWKYYFQLSLNFHLKFLKYCL